MHIPFYPNRLGRWLVLLGLLLSAQLSQAQVTRTIPGTYASFGAAFADLNTNGVPAGGVVIDVAAGYAETPAAPLLLTATGTAGNLIVFQKSGAGTNPRISAGVGTTTNLDAIVGLSGSDYVTFDGIDLAESAANTTAATQAEFGYALFRASPTDGCQFNIIRNCVVTLNKVNTGTFGIYGAASTATLATSVAATAPSGAHSNNKVDGNIITNSATGMYFTASTATTAANYDTGNEIGVITPNSVYNFGTTSTGWGIGGNYQSAFKVVNNVVNNTLNYAGGTTSAVAASTVTSTLRGIYGNACPSASIDITGNTITLATGTTGSLMSGIDNGIGSTPASNTVNITGNSVTLSATAATTGAITGITNSGGATTVNITGNTVQNSTATAATTATFIGITASAGAAINLNNNTVTNNVIAGTGTMTLISSSLVSAAAPVSISNNTLTGNSKTPSGTTAGTTLLGITLGTATTTITGNTITNNTIVTAGTSTSVGTLTGINSTAASTPSENVSNNVITGLSISGTSTATTNVLRGILTSASSSSVQTLTQNTIGGLSIASGSGTITGISVPNGGGTGSVISRNKIYDLSAAGTAGSATGLLISAGGTHTVANNLIGDLRTPAATGLLAVTGLNVTGSTAVNAYYNTLYLNATSSGATFGTSGIYLNSTTTTLDARNNVVVNKSTAAGTGGYTVALRRSSGTAGTAPANLASTTNNNLYYAGTPSATNLIYVEGAATATNSQQTLAAYKTFVAPRESNSVTEDVPFLSTTGTTATFLHINPATPTQVEGGGTPISSITSDFDGDARNAAAPDLGADEGTFTPQDLSGPTITLTALGNTLSTTNRTITVTIADPNGIATGANAPRLFFRKGTSGAFQSVVATSVSGSSYTFTFDYTLVGGVMPGDYVQYYVVAQDASANNNVSSNPLGGTFSTTPAQVYQYLIQTQLSGTYYVGTSPSPDPTRTYATLTAATTAYNQNALGGAVTFILLDASYGPSETFPIQILNNADASVANTLTIKPNSGASPVLTGSNASALLQLIGSDYVTLDGSNGGTISGTDPRPSRNWTINNTSTATSSNGIVLTVFTSGTDAATNNTFKNLVITGSGSATAQAGIIMLSTAAATAANNNNQALNNAVSGSVNGIYSSGPSATLKNTGTVISQNDMTVTGAGAIGRFGITAYFEDGVQITQNTIDGISFAGTGDVWGISAGFSGISTSTFTGNEVTNASIRRNYIGLVKQTSTYSAIGVGLAAATSGTSIISNNMVAGVSSNGTSGDFGAGIFIGGGTGSTTRILYNSVSMTGTQTGGNYPGYALAIGGSTPTVEIRNNALLNTQTTGSGNSIALGFAYSSTTGAYVGLTSDHNDFFVGTGATFAVGQTGSLSTSGVLRATLADLNTQTGQDSPTTSKSADPQFISATDLHSTSLALNNAGIPVSGVTVDFDGETRSTTTPDIGADEFTPATIDIAATDLVGPATTGCYGASETVSVSITNNSTTPINFATNPTTVTVTVTKPDNTTQVFTITVSTGTLAGGAAQTVTLPGTLDLSAAGTYSFAVTTSTTGDGTAGNDNLTATRTVTPVATQPQLVTFTGFTGSNLATVFPGWSEATGATLPTGTTSAWTSGTLPAGNTTAKVNLFSNTKNEWILSPKLLATTSTVLTFDAGLTNFNSSAADPDGMTGTDDFVEVRISTDCGLTYSRIPTFAQFNAGNQPSNGSLTTYTIDLSAYAGQQLILGFFASEGTVNDAPDYDFHLDNISVRSPLPVDLAPVALATPTATQGCYSATETVSVTVSNQGSQPLSFATNPATVTAVVTVPGGGTQTLSGSITSGTLAAGATQNVTLTPTLDMTALGAYSFAITASVTGDQNTSNDALPAVTRTVAAPVAGTLAPVATSICVSGTASLTLTGAANGSIQYQSSPDNVTFTDVAGATSATYTTPVLTSTTYYRAQVGCGTAVATSNVSTITVNNPLVASTNTPLTICAGSTATLTATASAGSLVRFFNAATGGTALTTTTPGSYTTPALTASATYYAEAYTGGSETVGKATSIQTNGGFSGTGTGIVFTTTGPLTLQSTTVYNATATAGSMSVDLVNNATGAVITTVGPFAIPAGSTTALVPTVLPLNLAVPAAGTYRLVTSSTPTPPTLYRDSGSNTFPYTSPSGQISITSGYISGTSTTYYFFFNIQVSNECAGATRTAIQVNVTQPATASFSAATASSCGTSPFQLTGTVGGSATGGTYSSSGTGTFAPNATTLNATYTPSAADVAAGSVTLTLTSSGSTPCPDATATQTLTISPAPVATFSYPAGTTYCAGSAGTVSPTLGTGATAGTFSSTTGLTINATTGVIDPATSAAGTYTVTNTVAASGGCASVTSTATVTINALPATPTYTYTYPTPSTVLFTSSVAPAGTTYQWYLNGVAITGATSQTYTANGTTSPGAYTVRFISTATGCQSAASTPLTVTATQSALAGTSLHLFPNPTATGLLTLQLSGYTKAVQLTVLDALGRVVLTQQVPAGQPQIQLNLSGTATGVYLLRATTEGGTDVRRIVRE